MSQSANTSLPKPTLAALARLVLGVGAAVALLGWVLPLVTRTTWREIIAVLADVPPWALIACFALALGFLASYAFVLRASLPGLTIPRALILNTAGTAVSKLFPGGGAVGLAATFAICRTWGFPLRAISTSAVVTGVWNTLTRVALPVVAMGLLVVSDITLPEMLRKAAVGAAVSGVIVLAIFVGILASGRVARAVGQVIDAALAPWLAKRGKSGRVAAAMADTRAQIIERVRAAWHWLTLGMIAFFATQLGIFLIALDVVGITIAFSGAFAAFAIGRLLTAVGITPGGVGITETGTAAALVALGANPAHSAAAVVLMSIFTNIIELPLGVLAWIAWSLDRSKSTNSEPASGSGSASDSGPTSGSQETAGAVPLDSGDPDPSPESGEVTRRPAAGGREP